MLDLMWLHYFDDYTMFDVGLLQDSSQKTAELLLESIGWGFATSDKKRRPASVVFQVLGAEIDLTNFKLGKACVKNKQDRTDSIDASLDALDVGNFVMRRSLESLRGKLLFANQMVFGYALANLRLNSCATDSDDARMRDYIRVFGFGRRLPGGTSRLRMHSRRSSSSLYRWRLRVEWRAGLLRCDHV